MTINETKDFYDYVLSFYGSDSDLYPEINATRPEVILATAMHWARVEDNFCGDSVDRESVCGIILDELREKVA